jgi:RNA polymerase sigma factor (sigma-70 family)
MEPLQPDEADELRRCAAGDEQALSAFYRRHLDVVLAFFMRRVRDRELALDLTAETFATVVVSAGTYKGEGAPVAWLFGIARNKLRESLRRDRVADAARRRLGMEPLVLDDGALELVEERAGNGESALALALGELPRDTRAALLARVVGEQDYGEIAARLQCSQQVVRQRVHRGLEQLRTGMKEDR